MVTKNEQVVTLEGMTRHNERPRWHVYLPPVCKCTTSQHELSFEGAWASLRSMCWGESSQRCRLKTNLCRCSKTFFTDEKVHHFLLQPLNYVLITCIDCKKKKARLHFSWHFHFGYPNKCVCRGINLQRYWGPAKAEFEPAATDFIVAIHLILHNWKSPHISECTEWLMSETVLIARAYPN